MDIQKMKKRIEDIPPLKFNNKSPHYFKSIRWHFSSSVHEKIQTLCFDTTAGNKILYEVTKKNLNCEVDRFRVQGDGFNKFST